MVVDQQAAEPEPQPMIPVASEPQPDRVPEFFTHRIRTEALTECYNDGEPFTLERWNHLENFLEAEFSSFYENGALRDEFEEYISEQAQQQGNPSSSAATTAPESQLTTSTQSGDP